MKGQLKGWIHPLNVPEGNPLPDVEDKFPVKHCPACNTCWEHGDSANQKSMNRFSVVYLDDFPKLGKEEVICPYCASSGTVVSKIKAAR